MEPDACDNLLHANTGQRGTLHGARNLEDSYLWWVCGTETNSSSPIPDFKFHYAILLIDWAGPTSKRTIWKSEQLPQTCLGSQAVFACPLSPLCSHSARRHMERNWGSHHWNASLRAADLLMTIVSLFNSLPCIHRHCHRLVCEEQGPRWHWWKSARSCPLSPGWGRLGLPDLSKSYSQVKVYLFFPFFSFLLLRHMSEVHMHCTNIQRKRLNKSWNNAYKISKNITLINGSEEKTITKLLFPFF